MKKSPVVKLPALAVHKTSAVPVVFPVCVSGVLAKIAIVMLLHKRKQHSHLKWVKKFFINFYDLNVNSVMQMKIGLMCKIIKLVFLYLNLI